MSRPRTAQEIIHWLELGAGSRWIRLAALIIGTLALSLLIAWKQFHGPVTETTLLQADVARQLAAGQGFTTLVNFPQTSAVLRARGVAFDPSRPYPELHQAPLYSIVIAGTLRLMPETWREKLFSTPLAPPDGWLPDYLLLGINLVLLWIAAWLTYSLGRRWFEARVGALAALGLLVSVSIWQETVAVNGTPLPMVLALALFHAWSRIEESAESHRVRWWTLALGVGVGLLFLCEYSAGAIGLIALGYVSWKFSGRERIWSVVLLSVGFLLVAGAWMVRNVRVTGSPVALAAQNVALKFGDSTAEPATIRATLSSAIPAVNIDKLGNKTLTALQENLKSRLWSGGAFWFTAFFVTGWLYPFRVVAVNRLRWIFTAGLGLLLLSQAALNSGESDRLVAVWLTPLILIFGAGFFFILIESNALLSAWPRLAATGLLALQGLPLLHDALEPRRLHFQYPPYFPSLFEGMRLELERRDAVGRFGIMADVPAGMAWYGRTRVWAQPPTLREFYTISIDQPIGELLLTPRTLDRPFFTELTVRSSPVNSLAAGSPRLDSWSGVYAGLLSGQFPRELPLRVSQKFTENLCVLIHPALPPPRGN